MQRQDLPVTPRGGLTDEQWNRIYPYLPVECKERPFDNVRDTVYSILWTLQMDSPWKGLPSVYENQNTIYKCFAKWGKAGVFESIFRTLSENADIQYEH